MKLGLSHSFWREASATFIDSRSDTSGVLSVGMALSPWGDSRARANE
jgi:hypothetical protein